ncbi:alpha/beta hydrolase [Streptomyces sp. NPDC042319]|uniref:alpha/beta fold hydrolase n=1 Tax=Streptomyces sp. NPDC042319 TaxID=3154332 RepID=UPI0033E62FF6
MTSDAARITSDLAVLGRESDLDVYVQGTGPALLLAHGAGGGIVENFGPVLDDLARDHSIVGPHYPGSGGSPVATGPLDLDVLVDQLVAAAVSRGHETFAVLGESLGTTVAVRAATRHPHRVTGLVLTAGFPVADPVLAFGAQLVRILEAAGDRDAVARFAFLACASEDQLNALSAQEIDAAVAQVRDGMPPGMPDHFDLVSRVDVRADLARVRVPTLVVAPLADRLVLPDSSRRLAAGIPGATLVELPGAGHILDADSRATWLRHTRDLLATLHSPTT